MSEQETIPPSLPAERPRLAGPQRRDKLALSVAVLALLVALAGTGYAVISQPQDMGGVLAATGARQDAALQAQDEKLARLAAEVQALQARPVSADPELVENSAGYDDSALQAKIAALEEALAGMRENLDAATQDHADVAQQTQDLATLKNQVGILNAAMASLRDEVDRVNGHLVQSQDKSAATRAEIIAWLQLREAAAGASPFVRELTNLRAAVAGNGEAVKELAALETMAQAGVPTLAMLQGRFNVMSRAALQSAHAAQAQDWWDRVVVSFESLVMVRKMNGTEGDDNPDHIVNSIGASLQRGEIAKAVTLTGRLPPLAQNDLKEWIDDATARATLNATLDRVAGALSVGEAAPSSVQEVP